MVTEKHKKQMQKGKDERKYIGFWIEKETYEHLNKLKNNMNINSISSLMRVMMMEWIKHKTQDTQKDLYASLYKEMVSEFRNKDIPIADRIGSILDIDDKIKEVAKISKKEE